MKKLLKKAALYFIATIILLLATGYTYLYILPKGPEVTESRSIQEGKDAFVMYAYKESQRKSIRVWTYKSAQWKDGDKIVFVMHGGGRNAEDYLDAWKALAETYNLLVIAPEFENKFYRYTTNDYQEGNLFTYFGSRNDREEWAYAVVENIFDQIRSANKITNDTYDIFGHSAGGQFVHRMVMLMPEARIGTAVAANAGFYSFPDETLPFPYGLKRTSVDSKIGLPKAYEKHLIVLLGELDNSPKLGTFRTTELAMRQGNHRLARGTNFFQANKTLSIQNDWVFNWKMDTVKNVGHNYKQMSQHAVKWLGGTSLISEPSASASL